MRNSWNQTLVTMQADGTALSNTTTPTSIIRPEARIYLGAGIMDVPGLKFRVKASGRISTAASTPGTLTLDLRLGSTVVFNGGASGTLATSATNLTWDLEIDLTLRSVGNSTTATLLGTGRLLSAALSATTPIMLLPASAPAVGTGFDSTTSQQLDLFATWSAASSSNSITCHQYEVVIPN